MKKSQSFPLKLPQKIVDHYSVDSAQSKFDANMNMQVATSKWCLIGYT